MFKNPILSFAIYTVLWSVLTSLVFFYFEQNANPNIHSWYDSFWWTIVTFTTVGYGDISPQTFQGKIVATLTMLVGIGFISNFIATMISMIHQDKKKGHLGMKNIHLKNHLIICGYHRFKTERFITEFRTDKKFAKIPIVLVSQSVFTNPIKNHQNIYFVQGDPTDEKTLIQASILQCDKVAVMAESLETQAVDDQTILTVLLIKELNPKVYITAEVSSLAKKNLLKKAHCDEIITLSSLSINLMVQALQDPGTTEIVEELITNTYGQYLHKVYLKPSFQKQTFFQLAQKSLAKGSLAIALEKKGKILLNPPHQTIAEPEDAYFFISSHKNRDL